MPPPQEQAQQNDAKKGFMDPFWTGLSACSTWADETSKKYFLTHFISTHVGWTLVFIFAHVLFWMEGFPTVIEYGYSDLYKDDNGAIPSGPSGSGVFPISVILMVLSSFAWFSYLFTWNGHYVRDEEEKQ
mmetsp:Transcript_11155/g.14483  ORF Transcript_11155/g.14483 Transcript_11155/m.14483 type:complete len:130 (+) Transcript_11155:153-542(+)|eukprot:CAMPEP_0117751394 /NCGR_PEP_ID=MMETSP0947-20121206/10944_1 /TAXON_ID=44440 /ORGANISM="Chattonella subsalsa, Strain CCMP2191" /LENGTH=129 /DNA_ID=CAMNT_0005569757 /DNA_START=147 /DNA_END=536 /DNA_ORIENTATION=-